MAEQSVQLENDGKTIANEHLPLEQANDRLFESVVASDADLSAADAGIFVPELRKILQDLLGDASSQPETLENTAVFFDLDGTLVNTIPLILAGFRHCFGALNLPYPGDEAMQATIGMPLLKAIKLYVPDEYVDEFNRIYEVYHREHLRRETAIYREAYACLLLLKALKVIYKQRGKRLVCGLFTSRRRWSMEIILNSFELAPFFDFISAGDEVKGHKPDAEPLLYCLEQVSNYPGEFKSDRVFYVGDAYFDLACANSAGYQSCLVAWTQNDTASFKGEKAAHYIENAYSLFKALFTVS